MRYYTPKLLERFASRDERIALAAQDELERRAERYADYLHRISPELPSRFRELQDRYYLHDATVDWPSREFARQLMREKQIRLPSFVLTIQLDAPPREVLVLHYRDVSVEPVPNQHAARAEKTEWRHDEVRLIRAKGRIRFENSILFGDGTELRIQFADFDFAVLKPMQMKSESENGNGSHKRQGTAAAKS